MDLHHLINSLLGLQDFIFTSSHFSEDYVTCRISAEIPFNKSRCIHCEHPFAPRWATKFITNLVCTKEAKVIANAAGRDAMALANCLKVLSKPQRLSVEFFAIDMNPGYFRAVSKLNTSIKF